MSLGTKVLMGKDALTKVEALLRDELASYQLVGRVMAYQGF